MTKIVDFSESLNHSWTRRPKLPKLLLLAQMDRFGDSFGSFLAQVTKIVGFGNSLGNF